MTRLSQAEFSLASFGIIVNRYFIRLGIWSLLIAASWAGAPADAAAPAALDVKSVKIGLAGYFQAGSWTPVTATVTTSGAAPVPAKLVVIAPDADGQLVRTAGEAKNLVPGQLETLHARFLPGRLSGDITVRLETADGQVHEQRIRPESATSGTGLRPGFRQETPFWGLCGLPTSVFDRAISRTTATDADSESGVRLDEQIPELIALTPADLPDDAGDLAAVDVIILAAGVEVPGGAKTFLAQMSAQQQRTLRDWVQVRGGHLVLSLGSHLSEFQQTELGKWLKLPLESELALRQLDGLESYSPHPSPLQVSGTVSAIRMGATTGNVLARSLDGPLLVQLPYGFGRVSFLAVNLNSPPLATWEGLGHLLRKLLSTEREQVREIRIQGAQLARSSVNDLSSQLFAALEEFPGVIRLSLWSVMALLGIYILIVGPLDYFIVHRWLQRPHWTWLTLILWVIVGGGLLVALSNGLNGTRLRSTQLEIVDLDEASRLLRGQSWLTLYSPRTVRSSVELSQVVPAWSGDEKIANQPALVSWVAPAENRIGGLYREGGVQLTQREYRTSESTAAQPASPGYADYPLQVWSTGRLGAEWSASTPRLVESKLVSSELGRLSGTVEHHLPDTLTDCMLAYANRVYFPIVRRAQSEGRANLAPHFVWEIGGSQPVEQRELRSFLTQIKLREVKRDNIKGGNPELQDQQTPYDPTRRDPAYIIRMLTFHQASGGRDYTGMRHDVLGNFDLSSHLRLGRAILLGRLKKSSAEWKVGGEVVTDENAETFVRIVLPVNRENEEEVRALPKPDEDLNKN